MTLVKELVVSILFLMDPFKCLRYIMAPEIGFLEYLLIGKGGVVPSSCNKVHVVYGRRLVSWGDADPLSGAPLPLASQRLAGRHLWPLAHLLANPAPDSRTNRSVRRALPIGLYRRGINGQRAFFWL